MPTDRPRQETPVAGRAPRGASERPVAAAAVAVLLGVVGLGVALWRPVATVPGRATDLTRFAPEVLAAVHAYRTPVLVAAGLGLLVSVAVPVAIVVTPAGRRLVRSVVGTSESAWRGAAVAAVVAGSVSLVRLPLRLWIGWFHDGAWGFNTASAAGWARDWLVGEGLTWIVAAVTGGLLVVVVRRWPQSWHWRLVPLGTALTAVLVLGYPLVVEPLLYRTEPVPAGEVREEITAVLQAAGTGDTPIVVADASRRTTKANAYVSGLGPTRRVVLYDTLLDLDVEEVGLVVAHELAHREHGDLWRGTLLAAAGLLIGAVALRRVWTSPRVRRTIGARGPADPRMIAAAAATIAVVNVAVLPASNALSRRAEAAADARAMELTGDPATFARVARIFTVRDLAAPDPGMLATQLWGTHPSVRDRIRAAAGMAEHTGVSLPGLAEVRRAEMDVRHRAAGSGGE